MSVPATPAQTASEPAGDDGRAKNFSAAGPSHPRRRWVRWTIQAGMVAALGAVAWHFATPIVRTALTTVSTDDAYVNAHTTHVAPGVSERVVEVYVDDNDFVQRGDLLIVLDKEPWSIRVADATALLDVANKALGVQLANARAIAAQAKVNRYKLASTMAEVRNRVASLRSAVASLAQRQAAERLAKVEADRYHALARNTSVTQQEADTRSTRYEQAHADVHAAVESIHSMRAALELPEEPAPGKPLDDVPSDLDQVHSSVRGALAATVLSVVNLGIELPKYDETPNAYIDRFRALAPGGDPDAMIEQTVGNAPAVAQARAQIAEASSNLALAKFHLNSCEIRADIDGFVSNRNVNPGNHVSVGQRLLAIRSSTDLWIDCNLKETQIEPIRIGHPVDLHVDAYPGRVFKGRVSGFGPATGSSLALFPPQNATGNFVKIVQRLPLRIELVDRNPKDSPLFVGLSVVPYIRVQEQPTGPNAGGRLRLRASNAPPVPATTSTVKTAQASR